MAVTVGDIASAPSPATIDDRRVDLTTGTVWRYNGSSWKADTRVDPEVFTALLANANNSWATYTPTLVNFTGTINWARYRTIGKSCRVHVAVTLDAVPTGRLEVSAPVAAASGAPTGNMGPVGTVIGNDVGTARRTGAAFFLGTTIGFGSGDVSSFWGVSLPHVWASGDTLAFAAEYESA